MALESNTWSGLENQAKAGYLKFDPADALAAAEACADLVDDLLGMAAAVTDLRLNNFAPIGTLTSGAQLAMAFTTKGSRLHTILNDHAKIVTDMGETYIAAGKSYTKTDGDSGDTFKALSALKMPTRATPYTPGQKAPGAPDAEFDKPSGGFSWKDKDGHLHVEKANAESFPSSLKDYQGAKDPGVTANIENKDSLSFTEMYELGRDLDPQPVLAAAGTWHSLANDLLGRLNSFVTVISAGTEAWEGQGATAAAEAVRSYSDGVQPLITSMIAMSQNLDYTAQWLHLTKLSMPATSDPGDCCPGRVTRRYRDEWQKHYGEGMKNTVSVMPVVNGPIAAPQPSGGQGQNQPGNNQNAPGNDTDRQGRQQPGAGGQQSGYGDQDSGNQSPSADYRAGYQEGYREGLEAGQGQGGSGPAGSGAGLPGGDTQTANSAPESRGGGSLPAGYDAAGTGTGSQAEGGPTGSGSGSVPAGLFGGAAGSQGSAAPARSSGGSGSSSSPRGSGSPGGQPETGTSSGMPDVPSLGSVPLPRMSSGAGGSPGGAPPGSRGTAPGANPGSLEDALARATGADPAQVRSVLDNLPGLLNEDTLSQLTGLPPEQVRSILDSIPDVVDENALSKLSGVDPAGVRSVLANLPRALDEQALAAATRTDGPPATGAGVAQQDAAAGAASAQGAGSLASAGREFLGQLGKALTQGLESLTQFGSTLPGAERLQDLLRQFDPNALAAAAGHAPVDPAGGGGAGSGPGGAGAEPGLSEHPTQQSRAAHLFPRASLPGAEAPLYPAAAAGARQDGVPAGAPMMGAPGAAGGAGQGNTAHKPAKFLQSKAHLDDAIGTVPDRVKPVIES
ncbi:WXG100 family type VII secretion target [Nocardia sp. NPDC057455]|uniref:WXG100 family type VII secretion target n=1 Tax=Nocardia sp. NPDC057455 TaxID=3346138 RepID=UPI0036702679